MELLPCIVQDARTGEVLTLAYMNDEALERTRETGEMWFWSRSREELWHKGATSGNVQRLKGLRLDCDEDAILALVEPAGPACHTGARTCFGEGSAALSGVLDELQRVIAERATASPESSYTARLLAKGPDQVLKKIGEEATEVVLAAKGESDDRLAEEAADLVYHLLVALRQRGVPFARVLDTLRSRRAGK